MGSFYGFKLHLACNDKGELLNFVIISDNVDNRESLTSSKLLKEVMGKLLPIKAMCLKICLISCFFDGIHLITTVRRNMKIRYITQNDRIILRKRAIIETVKEMS